MVSLWKCFAVITISVLFNSVQASTSESLQKSYAKQPTTNYPAIQFEKQKITLGSKTLNVEIAQSEAQQERGLMYRKSLGPDEGMLFIFKQEQVLYFWMKNTFINLSIGYFDKEGTLIDIQEMKAAASVMDAKLPNYPSAKPALYALEMNRGWFDKNKVKLDTKLKVLNKRQ